MSDEIASRVNSYREMEASCRARGMHENAKRWQGLAEAAQRDLQRWQSEQELQALDQAVEPSAEYCYVDEPGHTHGWYCPHPEHAYPQENSACPCGVEGCKGLDWLLDGNEPY